MEGWINLRGRQREEEGRVETVKASGQHQNGGEMLRGPGRGSVARSRRWLAVLLLPLTALSLFAQSPPEANLAQESRTRLLAASETYRQSLERLLILQREDAERAQAQVARNRQLLEMGLIARRQLETSEMALQTAIGRQAETARQLDSLDHLVTEVQLSDQLAQLHPPVIGSTESGERIFRFVGKTKWAMSDWTRVDAFFRLRFAKPLPVSAIGQTETHQHLGFDHREAIDVALHPDSEEGQALLGYLQTEGLSFIAIRGAIPGSATGAHIHIGPPSRRTTPLNGGSGASR